MVFYHIAKIRNMAGETCRFLDFPVFSWRFLSIKKGSPKAPPY